MACRWRGFACWVQQCWLRGGGWCYSNQSTTVRCDPSALFRAITTTLWPVPRNVRKLIYAWNYLVLDTIAVSAASLKYDTLFGSPTIHVMPTCLTLFAFNSLSIALMFSNTGNTVFHITYSQLNALVIANNGWKLVNVLNIQFTYANDILCNAYIILPIDRSVCLYAYRFIYLRDEHCSHFDF